MIEIHALTLILCTVGIAFGCSLFAYVCGHIQGKKEMKEEFITQVLSHTTFETLEEMEETVRMLAEKQNLLKAETTKIVEEILEIAKRQKNG